MSDCEYYKLIDLPKFTKKNKQGEINELMYYSIVNWVSVQEIIREDC